MVYKKDVSLNRNVYFRPHLKGVDLSVLHNLEELTSIIVLISQLEKKGLDEGSRKLVGNHLDPMKLIELLCFRGKVFDGIAGYTNKCTTLLFHLLINNIFELNVVLPTC
jgi:hypothetical protein